MTPSRTVTIGLVICAVLGAVDVLSVLGAEADNGLPALVLVIGLVLGVLTLVGLSPESRRPSPTTRPIGRPPRSVPAWC